MAEKKKSAGTTAVTAANSGARGGKGKSTSGSTGSGRGKKSSGSSTRADSVRNSEPESSMAVQLAPYGMIILAIILSICLIAGDSAGVVGGGIRNLLTGIAGGAAYLVPVFIIVETAMWKKDNMYGILHGKMTGYVSIFVLASILFHIFGKGSDELNIVTHFKNGCELIGGGAVGGMLGTLLIKGFGKVCTVILVSSVTCLLVMYIFGITPRGLWITLRYKLKIAQEKRMEMLEEKRAYESNYIVKRNRIREEEYTAYLKAKKLEEREAKQKAKIERDVEKRESKAARQQSMEPAASSVYRVSHRKIEKSDFTNDYVDDDIEKSASQKGEAEELIVIHPDELERVDVNDTSKDEGTVDEKIFDEVMRRTRERIEKNQKKAEARASDDCIEFDIPDSVKQGTEKKEESIILPPPRNPSYKSANVEEYSAEDLENMKNSGEEYELSDAGADSDFYTQETVEALNKADEYDYLSNYINSMTEEDDAARDQGATKTPVPAEKTASAEKIPAENDVSGENDVLTDTAKLARSMDGNGELDLSGLFVNPDDAELLDKLSAAYLKTPAAPTSEALAIERADVGGIEEEAAQAAAVEAQKPLEYVFPPIDILTEDREDHNDNIKEELQENAIKLVETLKSFNVKTKIEDISRGPTITRYELQPEPGTKVRSITNLVDDIALNLATTGVRIEAPIPGKAAVGIEVPNKNQSTVHLRTLIEMEAFQNAKSRLTVCLGENVAGEAVYFDIAKMPHLLIAGATGMGKSVCINSLITSLLYKAKPDEVKLILIDPKKVELSIYNGIPHLIVPVVSDPKKAAGSLAWAVNEMERRFGLIEAVGVRDIKMFNEVTRNDPDYEFMPQIVIIIDELADLMMTAPDDVEESICRLAQKARAAGMHLIIGTQRPSVDVITGLIKANIPSRIAFTVSSQVDSRTIIDKAGAENLIGRGDMLFNPVGAQKPMRVQGAFVSETDVEEVVSYIKNMNANNGSYSNEVLEQIEQEAARCGSGKKGGAQAAGKEEMDGEEEDPMLRNAIELAVDSGKISTSLIQRRLSLGYGRAAKLIDRMEQLGYVSAPDGSKPREVLITKQEFMEMVLRDE